jgi:hypothetical protein
MGTVKTNIQLASDIDANIYENATEDITGARMNEVLQNLNVSAINRVTDAKFLGVKSYNTMRQYESGEGCFYLGVLYQSNKIAGPGVFVSDDWDAIASGGASDSDYDDVDITDPTATITAPAAGKIKLVRLRVAADSVFSGLPSPSNSRKKYVIKQMEEFGAKFTQAIEGSIPGDASDYEVGDLMLSGVGGRITIVDTGTYEIV